jgi:coniferyl-aldehyde dehydrogenase
MNAPGSLSADLAIPAEFQTRFDAQREAFLKVPEPSHAERLADLRALTRLLTENQSAIIAAIDADYGGRSGFETMFGEIFASLDGLRDARKRLARWMRPRRRSVDALLYPGARNRLIPQPLGVVGVIVPWNYPIFLSFGPLTGAVAAGNRAMVKMSENSRRLAELLAAISPKYLPEDKLAFFPDGGGRGPAFSSLPFDHLFFTGSGITGRAVMANAARNLTPVTLELGGKSPAIVAPDFPIATAAERIMWAKTFNAGQICVAVDYAFLPRGTEDEFVGYCRRVFAKRYPDINGPDFTSIIEPAVVRPARRRARGRAPEGRETRQSRRGPGARQVEAPVPAAHCPKRDRRDGSDAARDLRSDLADPDLWRAAGSGRRDQCS